MKKTRISNILLWMIAISYTASAFAYNSDVYTGWFSDKAVDGYDTVAYFTDNKPIKGSDKFKYHYAGSVWYFASEKHLDMFKATPEKYRPQYGGYCAWAVAAKKSRAPGNPMYWKIVNKKLYLNYDKDVQKKWRKSIPDFIKLSDINWKKMTHKEKKS